MVDLQPILLADDTETGQLIQKLLGETNMQVIATHEFFRKSTKIHSNTWLVIDINMDMPVITGESSSGRRGTAPHCQVPGSTNATAERHHADAG